MEEDFIGSWGHVLERAKVLFDLIGEQIVDVAALLVAVDPMWVH